ncbi:Protein of unknown function, partial [Gryllus bimaculatus]
TEQPLMLADNTYADVRRFIRKDSSDFFNVSEGEYVTFVCPGSYNYVSGVNVSCYSPPETDVLILKSPGTCGSNTTIIEVGYTIPPPLSVFLKLYEVCYDPVMLNP